MIRLAGLPSRRESALAAVVLAVAAVVATVATVRAFDIEPPPEPIAPAGSAPIGQSGSAADGPVQLSSSAPREPDLTNDPFAPDRQLPVYVTEEEAAAGDAGPVVPTTVVIRILGTVVLPDGGGFAIYQMPSEVPKTLRIGERVGELTLIAVEPGKAVFRSSSGSRVTLTLVPTGA